MNREIEFRAFNKLTKAMNYGGVLIHATGKIIASENELILTGAKSISKLTPQEKRKAPVHSPKLKRRSGNSQSTYDYCRTKMSRLSIKVSTSFRG